MYNIMIEYDCVIVSLVDLALVLRLPCCSFSVCILYCVRAGRPGTEATWTYMCVYIPTDLWLIVISIRNYSKGDES